MLREFDVKFVLGSEDLHVLRHLWSKVLDRPRTQDRVLVLQVEKTSAKPPTQLIKMIIREKNNNINISIRLKSNDLRFDTSIQTLDGLLFIFAT